MAVRSGGVPVKTQTAKGLESLSRKIAEGAINVVPSPAVNVAAENTRVVDATGVSSIDITEEGVFHVTMTSGDVGSMSSTQSQVTNPVIVPQGETQMNAPITTTATNATTTTGVVGNISAAQAAATAPVAPVAPAIAAAAASAAPAAPEATAPVAPVAPAAPAAAAPVAESAISRLFSNESAWKEDIQSSLEMPTQTKNVRGRMNLIEDVVFDHEKRINALEKAKVTNGGRMTFSQEKSWEDVGYNAASAAVVGVGAVTGVYLATKALNAIFGSEPATE